MDSPPVIGDLADLTTLGHEFRVEITAAAGGVFTGIVRLIGPAPAVEAAGVRRDDTVTFSESNIKALRRRGGGA